MFEALATGAWDIAFMAIDPVRSEGIAFTAPYVVIEGVYVVPADLPLRTVEDVDREGVRVAVATGSAYDLYLTRALKRAKLVREPSGPQSLARFMNERLEAAAGVKQPVVEFAARHPQLARDPRTVHGDRAGDGHAQGRDQGVRYLRAFVEEMKATASSPARSRAAARATPRWRRPPRSVDRSGLRQPRRRCARSSAGRNRSDALQGSIHGSQTISPQRLVRRSLEPRGRKARAVAAHDLQQADGALAKVGWSGQRARGCVRHRPLPLSMGSLDGDEIVCRYHGLAFDGAGRCTRMPSQDKLNPRHACARIRWSASLRVGLPGDPAMADPALVPDMHWNEDPEWEGDGKTMLARCDYRLLVDNLMDLTHESFVHATSIGNRHVAEAPMTTTHSGRTVTSMRWMLDIDAPPFWRAQLGRPGNVDRWQIIRFEAPCTIVLDVGVAPAGSGRRKAIAPRASTAGC